VSGAERCRVDATAQELCLAADPFGCTYDIRLQRQPCTPKAWRRITGRCVGNTDTEQEPDVVCVRDLLMGP
jgi:hypothetical protein